MANIPSAKPTVKKISAKALTYALEGPEKPYPVYQFSDTVKIERPGRNPFAGIPLGPPRSPPSSSK